jgi:LPXTG-motif cell wall-anchored protein
MWLFGKNIDLFTLFAPVWLTWVFLFFLPSPILDAELPIWIWVVFVLMLDVGHVWSTIFRTYFDSEERKIHSQKLWLIPVVSFMVLFTLAQESTFWFWRVMAYLAVYHFIKQQYGFFILYSIPTKALQVKRRLPDKFVLYFSMVFPVIFWHFQPRNFDWFTSGDFFEFPTPAIGMEIWSWIIPIYFLVILAWLLEEILLIKGKKIEFSWGRILWLLTTAANWYIGIIYFNSDLAFTTTNVVAHGIPYVVLIIYYQNSKPKTGDKSNYSSALIAGTIVLGSLLFAYGEEFFWDLFLNQDKGIVFGNIFDYPEITSSILASFFLAILTLPQVVHYILDGYIWKVNSKNPHLKQMLKPKNG